MNNCMDAAKAACYIKGKNPICPMAAVILGSGMGGFVRKLEITGRVPFGEIPGMPVTTVEGHNGEFVFGSYEGIPLVLLNGRLHYYEGYSQKEISFPITVLNKLGVQTLVLTNAAGGINLDFKPGDLMLISDHINYSGSNPLLGPNDDELGPRFPDMSNVYNKELGKAVRYAAEQSGISLREGVYAMYSGPSYETPAEIRFLRIIGADAVGMSTVPEAIVANYCGMKVVGLSCITNMAAGILPQKLTHSEVIEVAGRAEESLSLLLHLIVRIVAQGKQAGNVQVHGAGIEK